MDADGARAFGFLDVPVSVREFLIIAVEIEANEFALAVDDGCPAVSADSVRRVDKIERRREIDFIPSGLYARGEVEGRHFAKT